MRLTSFFRPDPCLLSGGIHLPPGGSDLGLTGPGKPGLMFCSLTLLSMHWPDTAAGLLVFDQVQSWVFIPTIQMSDELANLKPSRKARTS